jgi:hypothetical protein
VHKRCRRESITYGNTIELGEMQYTFQRVEEVCHVEVEVEEDDDERGTNNYSRNEPPHDRRADTENRSILKNIQRSKYLSTNVNNYYSDRELSHFLKPFSKKCSILCRQVCRLWYVMYRAN